jgi:hypothetical protein
MPKQINVFVPAILILLPTAVFLKARTSFAQIVAADCITNPGSASPQGSHWYYRMDRMLYRRCWYLGTEVARMPAGAPRAELPMRLPPPTPLPAEFLFSTANAGTVAAQMTSNENNVDPSSILRWRRVTSSTTTGEPGSESNNVAIDADERTTMSAQDDMPLVWPALTPADVAAIDPQIVSSKRMLMMLAGAFFCAAMMVRLIVRRSGANPVVRTSPPNRFLRNSNRKARGDIARTPLRSAESDRATEVRILRRVAGLL